MYMTMNGFVVSRVWVIGVGLILGLATGARSELSAPVWKEVDCAPHVGNTNNYFHLVFSEDGQKVWVWWWPANKTGDFLKGSVQSMVVAVDGKIEGQRSPDSTNWPAPASIAWRETRTKFVERAVGWCFEPDLKRGLRIRETTGDLCRAELVEFGPEERLVWATDLPETLVPLANSPLMQPLREKDIVLAGMGGAVVLDPKGGLRSVFSFGSTPFALDRNDPVEGVAAVTGTGSEAGRFFASQVAYCGDNGLLAAGMSNGRRVRVFGVTGGPRLARELAPAEAASHPHAGGWYVRDLRFECGGKYLVTVTRFAGRGSPSAQVACIYGTRSWKPLWSSREEAITGIGISPDGRLMAVMMRGRLSIGPTGFSD